MRKSILLSTAVSVLLASTAVAQDGTDTCTAPTAIGEGTFAFDTTTMVTNDDLVGSVCTSNLFGAGPYMYQDTFWVYTATAAGLLTIDTEGTSWDTQLAVYSGVDCNAVCVDNDDDSATGLQSSLSIPGVNVGDTFVIEVGGYSATNFGAGTLNVSVGSDPCAGIVDDALEDNDDCLTAGTLAIGYHAGLVVTALDADYYSVTIPTGDILTAAYVANSGDVNLGIYDASCTLIANGLIGFSYANITGAPETIILEVVAVTTGTTTCGDYDLDLTSAPDPCQTGPDDAFEDNDDCATATPMVDGTYPALFASSYDKDHYSFCVADGATVDIDALFVHATDDMDIVLWDSADANCGLGHNGVTFLAEGWSASDNETISWTNTTGADLDVILEVNLFNGASCNNYDLIISGAGCGATTVGTPFCDPGSNNSTGVPAVLVGTLGTGVGSDLHLEISGGVPGQLAYFLVGNEATAGIPISGGLFCLVGTPTAQFFRFNVAGTDMNSIGGFNASGIMINAAGTSTTGFGFDVPSTIPDSVPVPIMAGDTWHFQGWYRDTPAGAGSSNFTNGLSVTF